MPQSSRSSDPPVILVADADGEAAQRLAHYLSSQGFLASHTSRGEDVLNLARAGNLGFAILNVSLLDMSGLALASWLKEIDRRIVILMTTEDYRPEVETRARQVGVVYYAQKPVDDQRLGAVVAKILGKPDVRAFAKNEVLQVPQRVLPAE